MYAKWKIARVRLDRIKWIDVSLTMYKLLQVRYIRDSVLSVANIDL